MPPVWLRACSTNTLYGSLHRSLLKLIPTTVGAEKPVNSVLVVQRSCGGGALHVVPATASLIAADLGGGRNSAHT
jgi:hypothetical protein